MTMGNAIKSMFAGQTEKMKSPKTLDELAGLVVLETDMSVEDSINKEKLPKIFYERLQDKDMKLLFVFIVLAVILDSKNKKKQEKALFELQNRVFSNARTGIANIKFRDTERVVGEIFE